MAKGTIYVAREGFSGTLSDGVPFNVNVGQTVREGHPILKGREMYFVVADTADFEWGEPNGSSPRPRRARRLDGRH